MKLAPIIVGAVSLFLLYQMLGPRPSAHERTVVTETPVCGYDPADPTPAPNQVRCGEMDGRQEVHLPCGSLEAGREGWKWEEDMTGAAIRRDFLRSPRP